MLVLSEVSSPGGAGEAAALVLATQEFVANGGGRSSLRRRRSAEAPGQTGSRGRDGRRGWSRSIAELGEPSVHAFSFWAKACVRPAGPGRTRSWQCTSATVPGGTIKRQQRIAVVADVPAVIGSRLKRSRRRGCRFDGQAGVPPPAGARMPVADCESGARWCRCRQRWRSCLGSGWASAGRLRLLCSSNSQVWAEIMRMTASPEGSSRA
jgi:hypothetical protein